MINISKKLSSEIEGYCAINGIENPDRFANNLLKRAFTAEKFGDTPFAAEVPVRKPSVTRKKAEPKPKKTEEEKKEKQEPISVVAETVVIKASATNEEEKPVPATTMPVETEEPKRKRRKLS